MAVTAEQLITARIPGTGRLREGLVEAGEILYGGTAGFVDADGFITPVMTGPLDFAGVVRKTVDNSAGADGAEKVELYTEIDWVVPLTSAAQADVGSLLYATDNFTFTLTSTSNSLIGVITRFVGTGLVEVRVDIEKRA